MDLKSNMNIVIKPADKGSAVVVMNTTDYIREAEKQLSNTSHYQRIPEDLTTKHEREVLQFLCNLLVKDKKDGGSVVVDLCVGTWFFVYLKLFPISYMKEECSYLMDLIAVN